MKLRNLFTIIAILAINLAQAQMYNVEFRVDVSQQDVGDLNVHIAGDFNSWCESCAVMIDEGNGIYSYVAQVEAGSYAYKYNIGDWNNGENLTQGDPCTVTTDFTNRITPEITEDTVLPTVCWNSCEACPPVNADAGCTDSAAQNYNTAATEDDGSCEYLFTFQVDMSNETVVAEGVYMVGSFNGWDPSGTPMSDAGNGIWEVTILLVQGSSTTYTFLNGPSYDLQESVPSACGVPNGFGGFNREYIAGVEDTTIEAVCFDECVACETTVPVLIVFQVDMSNETASAEGVYIVGDFNDWDATATQMVEIGDGVWQAGVLMTEGEQTRYKFLNGPTYDNEETVPMECGEENDFSGYDRIYTAGSQTETLDAVCFSGCGACQTIETLNITFAVDMSSEMVDAAGVHLAGSFNGFSPTATPMTDSGNGIYEANLDVPQNTEITYKYINGNDFATAENVPFECGIDDGFGGYNRNYVTMTSDVVLAPVCFGECDADCDTGGGETINMTFRVDMFEQFVDPNGVHLAGSFNGFSPTATPMTDAGNGIYEANLNVPQNSQITFKYINGNNFATSETVPFECGEEDGFGGYNRFYNTTTSAVSLNPVCFSSCDPCVIDNINEVLKTELKVGPNPIESEGIVTIIGGDLTDVYLMDLTGRTWKLDVNNNNAKLPSVATGVYVIQDLKSGLRTQILVH